jgi:hypothetical protein
MSANGAVLATASMGNPDRDGVTVLDEEGHPLFSGCEMDAEAFMDAYALTPDDNCQVVLDPGYLVGWQ